MVSDITKLRPGTCKRGVVVSITGARFGAKRGASTVSFGAAKATEYLSWSAKRIRCTVPSAAKVGRVAVRVKTKGGKSNAEYLQVKR